jgi:hypothetical protein
MRVDKKDGSLGSVMNGKFPELAEMRLWVGGKVGKERGWHLPVCFHQKVENELGDSNERGLWQKAIYDLPLKSSLCLSNNLTQPLILVHFSTASL